MDYDPQIFINLLCTFSLIPTFVFISEFQCLVNTSGRPTGHWSPEPAYRFKKKQNINLLLWFYGWSYFKKNTYNNDLRNDNIQNDMRSVFTFLCMEVYFHSGVSPGVQNLPCNNTEDWHPEKHRSRIREGCPLWQSFSTTGPRPKSRDFNGIFKSNQSQIEYNKNRQKLCYWINDTKLIQFALLKIIIVLQIRFVIV